MGGRCERVFRARDQSVQKCNERPGFSKKLRNNFISTLLKIRPKKKQKTDNN